MGFEHPTAVGTQPLRVDGLVASQPHPTPHLHQNRSVASLPIHIAEGLHSTARRARGRRNRFAIKSDSNAVHVLS
eukprot:3362326-Alexandrium_andersonii.AAC.1